MLAFGRQRVLAPGLALGFALGFALGLALGLVLAPVQPAMAAAWLPGDATEAAAEAVRVVEVVDDTRAAVRLARPARRIVSLAPHLTELLFDAGAGSQVVGAVAFSDHPPAARAIPRVGDAQALDLERVATLRPDLIVLWQDGTPAAQRARLASLGIPVYASAIGDFADVASTLRRLGRLTGHADAAAARADAFEREIATLRARYAERAPLRVFFQVWRAPLMTVNGHHLISRVLTLCGARNVFADLPPLVPTVDPEAVVAADPDAIVTARVPAADGVDPLAAWRGRRALRAVRGGHLIEVEPDPLHRPSTRIADGARDLCQRLDAVRGAPAAPR